MEGGYAAGRKRKSMIDQGQCARLGLRFPIVEMPVLPIEPGMTELVREDVSPPGDGKLLS